MTKDWTANLVGLMHMHRITQAELAKELGVTNRYVCMVLNRHREPKGAQQRFEKAMNTLIAKQSSGAKPVVKEGETSCYQTK